MSEKQHVLTLADIQKAREMLLRKPAPGEMQEAFERMVEFVEAMQDADKRREYAKKYMTLTPDDLDAIRREWEGRGDE